MVITMTLKEYLLAVAREVADVKLPKDFDGSKVGNFLRYCYERGMSPSEAAGLLIIEFGHGDTLH